MTYAIQALIDLSPKSNVEQTNLLVKTIAALSVDGGYVMVPREPTSEMRHAGFQAMTTVNPQMRDIYRAMIAAASPSPAAKVDEGMVERVAKAIYDANQRSSGMFNMFNAEQLDFMREKAMPMYMKLARAAIEAMEKKL